MLAGAGHAMALWFGHFFLAAATFLLLTAASFSYMYAYLAFTFGFEYYGLLAGICQSVASIATFALQPILYSLALSQAGGWPQAQLVQAAAFMLVALLIAGGRRLRRCRLGVQWKQVEGQCASPALGGTTLLVQRGLERSYSAGDMHSTPSDTPFRRRPDLFPNADDILVIDGAHAHCSRAAYCLEASIESPGREGKQGQQLTPTKFAANLAVGTCSSATGLWDGLSTPVRTAPVNA